jgi:drug/metabolite transporter (DMT)-like permease
VGDLQQQAAPKLRLVKVIAWMTGALTSFVFAAVAIRELSKSLNVFEINVCRTGGGLLTLAAAMCVVKSFRGGLSIKDIPQHLSRNIVHAAGGFFWTLSIFTLPLATVFSLEFTAPAWAAIMSMAVLGERVRGNVIIGLVASFIGTLIILRPSPDSFNALALLPLAAGLCLGLSALLTRRLTRSFDVFAILFWMMVIQLIINCIGELAIVDTAVLSASFTPQNFLAAGVLALAGLSSQLCLSQALKIGEASLVMPLDFLRVPLIAGVGALYYGEAFDHWVMIGAAVIATGVIIGLPRLSAQRGTAAQP